MLYLFSFRISSKLLLLSFVVVYQLILCAQQTQDASEPGHRKCYVYELASERHQVSCESQDLRCSKTRLMMLHASNLMYDQQAKNLAAKLAIKECDYCATKFWLEHGAEFKLILQPLIDESGTLSYRYNPHALDHLLFDKNDKLFQIYQSPAVLGKMLCVLKLYGVKRIQVHAAGRSSDATCHSKSTTYE